MLGNYGSNLETQRCGVEAIGRPQKDEASSLLPIFQTKLAILRQKDIVFFFLHQSQVVSWNLHSYFSPDRKEWDNRFQQIQQLIIAEQLLTIFFELHRLLSTIQRFNFSKNHSAGPWKSVHYTEVSTIGRYPLWEALL